MALPAGRTYHRKVIPSDCTGYSGLPSGIHKVKVNVLSTDITVDCDISTTPYKMMIIPTDADGSNELRSVFQLMVIVRLC